ncbi:hypothetical protein IP84_15525 [beta proteobacterium AAP99]|nr:hypothetical protein IP84_15525 [beta proteobacterium AAP99]
MIISPPFLADRGEEDTDEQWIAKCMKGDAPGHGTFPVSFNMCWHGGLHLEAPTLAAGGRAPVRAIADGDVVYHRDATPESTDVTHAQNYSDTAGVAKWTDNGVVVIKHTTDIGTGEHATNIVYYSIYMHLSGQIKAAAHKGQRIYRKDEIGTAGKVYGDAHRIHFEIICDDANLRKLIGRPGTQAEVATTAHGRSDAVFGEIYFQLPSGAHFYATKPADNVTAPPSATNPPVHTVDADNSFYVGMRYRAGDGPAAERGAVYFYAYTQRRSTETGEESEEAQFLPLTVAGTKATVTRRVTTDRNGRKVTEDRTFENYEYEHYLTATNLSAAQPATGRPAPSAVYEMLRFGRVIDTANETAVPHTVPNWQKVAYSATEEGWVNLNATDIRIFSDADFPHWAGWTVLNDDGHAVDSRSEASKIKAWVTDPADANKDRIVNPAELESRLNASWVKKRLEKTIAKFPTDWVDTEADINAQWGWLKIADEAKLVMIEPMKEDPDYKDFKAHVKALGWWGAAAISGLEKNHWHLQPRAFIAVFIKSGWLSINELTQCLPRRNLHLRGTTWENQTIAEWGAARTRLSRWTPHLNLSMRKYCISSSKQRIAHFLAQVIEESGYLQYVKEGSGETASYAPWYGRGLIQLTHLANYKKYGAYRGFPASSVPVEFTELGWNPNTQLATDNSTYNAHNCADSACFYWTCPEITATGKNVLEPSDEGITNAKIIACSRSTNGNVPVQNINGLGTRMQAFVYMKYLLLNLIRPGASESLTFDWRRNSNKELLSNADGSPALDRNGRQKKGYIATTHTIDVPLDYQRPR